MANRVCLGNRNGVSGLFVSRPGYDVLTTDDANLMFDSRNRGIWVHSRGSIVVTDRALTATIPIFGLDYAPIVQFYTAIVDDYWGGIQYSPMRDNWEADVTNTRIVLSTTLNYSSSTTFYYVIYGVPF